MLIGEWKLSGEFCFKAVLLSTFRKTFKMNALPGYKSGLLSNKVRHFCQTMEVLIAGITSLCIPNMNIRLTKLKM